MPRIDNVTPPFALPEGALCLGPLGWTPKLEEVQIGLDAGLSLERALEIIDREHRSLLGFGDIVFAQTGMTPAGPGEPPRPTGYVTFIPAN